MRAFSGVILMGAGALALAGCSGGGDREALVDQAVQQCLSGIGQGGMSGMDPQRVCTCAVGKMTEGKDAGQIREMFSKDEPGPAEIEAMGACLVEELQRQN